MSSTVFDRQYGTYNITVMEKAGQKNIIYISKCDERDSSREYCVNSRAGHAFLDLRSRVPGILGPPARGNAIFFKACGNAEYKEVGGLILRA